MLKLSDQLRLMAFALGRIASRIIEPWDIDQGTLKPMGFLYSLPN
jgi:hypothetical protein